MVQPDVSDVHVNKLLTNISIAYMQDDANFIADKVFPIIPVDNQTDVYARYNRDAWFRDFGDRMRRAPGTIAARSGWTIDTTQSYKCMNEALGTTIPDELRANADAVYNLDADATRFVTNAQLIRRERLFNQNFMKTGVWTTEETGGTSGSSPDFVKWSDYQNSDPFGDVERWREAMRVLIGRYPTKMVMDQKTWTTIKNHPAFIDRIKGGATTANPALFTRQMFASFVEIPEVLVDLAVYNTASEEYPAVDPTMSNIMGDGQILMLYTPDAASLLTPAAGYQFIWRPLTGGSIQYIRKYRDDPARMDVIESYSYLAQVVTAPDAGIYLDSVV